jgi:hypothetical protein
MVFNFTDCWSGVDWLHGSGHKVFSLLPRFVVCGLIINICWVLQYYFYEHSDCVWREMIVLCSDEVTEGILICCFVCNCWVYGIFFSWNGLRFL